MGVHILQTRRDAGEDLEGICRDNVERNTHLHFYHHAHVFAAVFESLADIGMGQSNAVNLSGAGGPSTDVLTNETNGTDLVGVSTFTYDLPIHTFAQELIH